MDIRDTVSRVLLGIAFGFVMGIVMYQAAGIDADVINKSVLRAQTPVTATSTGVTPCGGPGAMPGPSGCCSGYVPGSDGVCWPPCTGTNMGPGCSSSSATPVCTGFNEMDCGGGVCCSDVDGYCSGGVCVSWTSSSSSTFSCPSGQSECNGMFCCNPGEMCTSVGCGTTPSSSPSSGGSSSGGCCNTATNECQ